MSDYVCNPKNLWSVTITLKGREKLTEQEHGLLMAVVNWDIKRVLKKIETEVLNKADEHGVMGPGCPFRFVIEGEDYQDPDAGKEELIQ